MGITLFPNGPHQGLSPKESGFVSHGPHMLGVETCVPGAWLPSRSRVTLLRSHPHRLGIGTPTRLLKEPPVAIRLASPVSSFAVRPVREYQLVVHRLRLSASP